MTLALQAGLLLAAAAGAGAVEHPGALNKSLSVHFQPGDDQKIYLSTNMGLLYSPDDGETWLWTCEQSLGFFGNWDPVVAITASGAIFVTTPDGLRVSRDGGCDFATIGAPLGDQWISDLSEGPDGALWMTTASGGVTNDVYVSRDDGATFAPAGLASDTAYWKTVRVAPGDADRIYVTGYSFGPGGSEPQLRRSLDGGMIWETLPFAFMAQSQVRLLAVSPIDPDVVFLRVDAAMTDTILRSDDGALSIVPVLTMEDNVTGFAARADGMRYVTGSAVLGVQLSGDGGLTWQPPADMAPMITNFKLGCVAERPADGELFACGHNWVPDKMALGRSVDDAVTWTKIFRFNEIDDELDCPAATTHAADCDWATIAPDAGSAVDAGAGIDAGTEPSPDRGCGCGISVAFAFFVLPRRRQP